MTTDKNIHNSSVFILRQSLIFHQ